MSDKQRTSILNALKYLILLTVVFIVIYPLVGVFLASFKTKIEYLSTDSMVLPLNWGNFENYKTVLLKGNVITGFANTLFIIFFSCIFSTLLCTMVAYCFTRFEFAGKNYIDKFYMMASFVPSIIVHLIIFKDFAHVGLVNNLFSIVILYSGVDIVSLYLFKQYFNQISVAVDESAIMEGCSYVRVYWNILLPMVKPAIVTACIIKITYIYNDFYTASYIYPPRKKE